MLRMSDNNQFPIILYTQSTINLASVHKYALLWEKVLLARLKFSNLVKSTIKVCTSYIDKDLLVTTRRLRLEIRLATRGTGTNYSLDSVADDLYINANTEQLYNAQTVLLKSAYRKVAMLVHPDRGGDDEMFNAVYSAYKNRDLTFLQEYYIMHTYSNDLFWKQSEGIDYALQELQRPAVSLEKFKSNPLYAVNRLHVISQKEKAQQAMKTYQLQLNVVLAAELKFIMEKYNG